MESKKSTNLTIYDIVNTFNTPREIDYDTFVFSGGEVHIKIKDRPRGDRVRINCRINSSDDLMRLMMTVDTLRRMDIHYIEAFIPYIPYARQDRVMVTGEPLSIKVFADIINSLRLDHVYCFDPHSEVTAAVINNLYDYSNWSQVNSFLHSHVLNGKNQPSHIAVKDRLDDLWGNLMIVSPDAGAYKKIFKLCQSLKYPGKIILCNKLRDVNTGKIINVEISGDVSGKPCLIVDDIVDGGRTFNELAAILKEKGATDLHLFASHGIFSHGYEELLKNFKTIGTTDSIRDEYPETIKVIKLNL